MHSRNFCTHNNAKNNNNNSVTEMKSQAIANNNNLNPLGDNTMNNHSGMTHNENGLRAASHVSMEHTIAAHEYQPTCNCEDCQALLNHYTQYDILDAYVTHHLAYESTLRTKFGFVPAVGGPNGHIAMTTVLVDQYDEQTGEVIGQEEQQQPVPSNSYLFHMHLHHMKPVPADVKERSHARFYAPKETVGTATNNNNMSIPAPNSKRGHNNNNATYNKRNNNNNHHYNNNNNYYGHNNNNAAVAPSVAPVAAAPSYNSYHQNYANATAAYYTHADVEQANNASNFTGGAARLGN